MQPARRATARQYAKPAIVPEEDADDPISSFSGDEQSMDVDQILPARSSRKKTTATTTAVSTRGRKPNVRKVVDSGSEIDEDGTQPSVSTRGRGAGGTKESTISKPAGRGRGASATRGVSHKKGAGAGRTGGGASKAKKQAAPAKQKQLERKKSVLGCW